jgi:hypothetical protein
MGLRRPENDREVAMTKKLDRSKQLIMAPFTSRSPTPIKTTKLLRAQQEILAPLKEVEFPFVCEADIEDSRKERKVRWRLEFYNLSEDTAAGIAEAVADWYETVKRQM